MGLWASRGAEDTAMGLGTSQRVGGVLWGWGRPYGAGAVPVGLGPSLWGWAMPMGLGPSLWGWAVPMRLLPHGFPPQDFGYIQTTATEVLRSATHGEPETTKAFSLLDLRSVGLVRGSGPTLTPP